MHGFSVDTGDPNSAPHARTESMRFIHRAISQLRNFKKVPRRVLEKPWDSISREPELPSIVREYRT